MHHIATKAHIKKQLKIRLGAVFIQPGEFNYQWLAQTDIICQAMCGILPIDVTKENSC